MWSDLIYRQRALVRRRAVEGELDDGLRFHFERQVENAVRTLRKSPAFSVIAAVTLALGMARIRRYSA